MRSLIRHGRCKHFSVNQELKKTNTSDNHGGGGPELPASLTGCATDRLKNKRRTKKAIKILYKGEDFNPATLTMIPQYSAAHLVLLLKKTRYEANKGRARKR